MKIINYDITLWNLFSKFLSHRMISMQASLRPPLSCEENKLGLKALILVSLLSKPHSPQTATTQQMEQKMWSLSLSPRLVDWRHWRAVCLAAFVVSPTVVCTVSGSRCSSGNIGKGELSSNASPLVSGCNACCSAVCAWLPLSMRSGAVARRRASVRERGLCGSVRYSASWSEPFQHDSIQAFVSLVQCYFHLSMFNLNFE